MTFWLFASLLTLLALLSICYPLFLRKRKPVDGDSYEKSVYLEQLDEVDRDFERGQIGASEAELAKAEIARRLIALDTSSTKSQNTANFTTATLVTAICTFVLLPIASVAAYMALGNPQRADMPLEARMKADPKTQTIEELVARAEARAKKNPNEVQGWLVLAPVYIRLGRADDAVLAYRKIISLAGSTAKHEASLGEALTIAAGGVITTEARQHFVTAAKADPSAVKPRFFLAVALGQENKFDEAIQAWETMLAKAPKNAAWYKPAQGELDRIRQLAGQSDVSDAPNVASRATPPKLGGPSRQDIANAASMSAEDRTAMIAGMVANLEAKLEEDPSNIDGWLRIIRSYAVMGRRNDAATALTKAVKQFETNPAASKKLNDLAVAMNIEAIE
jgi:cytochrome c-type biogenesis protein CcmH